MTLLHRFLKTMKPLIHMIYNNIYVILTRVKYIAGFVVSLFEIDRKRTVLASLCEEFTIYKNKKKTFT
jgi:hypothetical protein